MIYVVVSNKGGVAKSLLSHHVISLLVGDSFEILEVDNNNDTAASFSKSDLLKGKARTIRVNKADDALDDVFFEALSSNKNIIIDGGGGDDSNHLLTLIAEQPQENIRYIIPTVVGADEKNVLDTYSRIPNKDNVLFILSGYHDKDNLKEEFLYFLGDETVDVESVSKKIGKKINYVPIPFSTLFNVAQRNYNMTIFDLAALSKGLNPEEASQVFLEESKGDKLEYRKLYKRYKTSLRANKLVVEIMENLADIV